MTIDKAYRSAYAGVKVPYALIERTERRMKNAPGRKKTPVRPVYRYAAACLSLAVVAAACAVGVFRLRSAGTAPQESTAADGTRLANGSEASAASENTMMALEDSASSGAVSGRAPSSGAPSGSPSGSGPVLSGNVAIMAYRIYGDRFYKGNSDQLSESDLGRKLADAGEGYNAPCYEIRGIPVSQSIAFDYHGVVVRYDSFMSSCVNYKGTDYGMVENWTSVCRDEPPVGKKLGTFDGMTLYDAGGKGRIWVDVLPKLGLKGTQPGDRTLYLAVA